MNIIHLFKLILPIFLFISISSYLYALFGPIGPTELIGVLFVLILIVVILLILREVLCWYWKINERVSLLKDIQKSIASIRENGEKKERQNNYVGKDFHVDKVEEKKEAEKAEEREKVEKTEKKTEAEKKIEAEKAIEIAKKKLAAAKREADLGEEYTKNKDDDFLKY